MTREAWKTEGEQGVTQGATGVRASKGESLVKEEGLFITSFTSFSFSKLKHKKRNEEGSPPLTLRGDEMGFILK